MSNQNVDINTNFAKIGLTSSTIDQPTRQINPYKLVGRVGLLGFILVSGWVAFTFPLIWWAITGGLFAAVGLVSLHDWLVKR